MLDVGLIGLGPAWETRYRPALHKLRDRLRIRAIYDVVYQRAAQVAAELKSEAVDGLDVLLARPDLSAYMLLDPDWLGNLPVQFAVRHHKSMYVAGTLGDVLGEIRQLRDTANDHGVDLMPEFSRRYTPATIRLRELLATQLGRVKRLRMEVTLPPRPTQDSIPGQTTETDLLVGLVDWCRCLMGATPVELSSRVSHMPAAQERPAGETRSVNIVFQKLAVEGEPRRAEILVRMPDLPQSNAPVEQRLHAYVDCQHGHATLVGNTHLEWRLGDRHGCELLDKERQDVEVMLDHFCRRAVGGLIPIPTIDDVHHALGMVYQILERTT